MVKRSMVFFIGLLLALQTVQAEIVIEVTQGKQSAIPIAVVPFSLEAGESLPEDLTKIIHNDLGQSGYFRTMPTENMISQPNMPSQVNYDDWSLLRQDYVVVGNITVDPAGYAIEFHVLDVHLKAEVLRHRVKGKKTQMRDLAHYISDYIFENLTGIPGVFSTKLVYVTTNRERNQFNLNYADADGARERLIFSSKQPIISPTWSPDGKKIAYVSFENGQGEIFFQELATGKRERVVAFSGSSFNSAPSFSPDGKSLAFVISKLGNPDIYMMDIATRKVRRLTTHYAIDTEPQWDIDGEHLFFTSNRAGGPQIYRMNVSSLAVKRVTFDGNYNARPRITADGRKLIYVNQTGGRFHIASQDLATGRVNVLTSETELDESPSVAPNGSMVVYAASEKNRSILAAVSVDGDVKFRLPSKYGDVREPAWSPIFK